MLHVGHPDDRERRALFRRELPFHRREFGRLIFRHVRTVEVAGRKNDENRKDERDDHARTHEEPSEPFLTA